MNLVITHVDLRPFSFRHCGSNSQCRWDQRTGIACACGSATEPLDSEKGPFARLLAGFARAVQREARAFLGFGSHCRRGCGFRSDPAILADLGVESPAQRSPSKPRYSMSLPS